MTTTRERTLVLIKPDAHAKGANQAIEATYHRQGFVSILHRYIQPDKTVNLRELVQAHYETHKGRSYYDELVDFMTSGPLTAIVFEGENIIERVRKLTGETDPRLAEDDTIRQRFGTDNIRNAVHASDSPEAAEREIAIWFTPKQSGR